MLKKWLLQTMHFLIKFDNLKNLSIKQANTFKSEDDFPPRHTSNLYFFANVALLLFLKQLFFFIINCICISKYLFHKLTVVRRDTRFWSLRFSNFKTNKKVGTSQQKMFITEKTLGFIWLVLSRYCIVSKIDSHNSSWQFLKHKIIEEISYFISCLFTKWFLYSLFNSSRLFLQSYKHFLSENPSLFNFITSSTITVSKEQRIEMVNYLSAIM